jgi:hypothetical protein
VLVEGTREWVQASSDVACAGAVGQGGGIGFVFPDRGVEEGVPAAVLSSREAFSRQA